VKLKTRVPQTISRALASQTFASGTRPKPQKSIYILYSQNHQQKLGPVTIKGTISTCDIPFSLVKRERI